MNPSGQLSSCSFSATRNSAASAVSTSSPGPDELVRLLARRAAAHAGLEALLDVHQPLVGLGRLAVRLLLREHAGRHERARRTARASLGSALIRSYMTGWVYAGSSPSLWPWRR